MSHIVGDTPLCVSHNREKLSKEINLPLTKWVMVAQCHSDNIVKVSHQDRGKGLSILKMVSQMPMLYIPSMKT